jgi:hypothetical protein
VGLYIVLLSRMLSLLSMSFIMHSIAPVILRMLSVLLLLFIMHSIAPVVGEG